MIGYVVRVSDNAGRAPESCWPEFGPCSASVAGIGTAVPGRSGGRFQVQKDDPFLRDKLIERQDLMFQKLEQRIERLAQQIDEMNREENECPEDTLIFGAASGEVRNHDYSRNNYKS